MEQMIKNFLLIAALVSGPASARAQDFDYLVMALSWTPSFCEAEGGERNREQCDPSRDLGFTLHGLWPQYEDGWPEYCETEKSDPTRAESADMADIMGSGGLAWYQWKKHGRCTGLKGRDYYGVSRLAYNSINNPDNLEDEISAQDLESAFIRANPDLDFESTIVTCRGDYIREVRICLDFKLNPRDCAPDMQRSACRYKGELDLPPIP
jgi:ribonuclease T2